MTTAPSPSARLAHLRQLMATHDVGAYVVPSDDQHASEYVADADKRREWISAFTGSAGTAVVLGDEAHLFTDGRYHQQAAKELSSEWTLQKYGLPEVKNWQEHLTTLPTATRIGLDPTLLSIADFKSLEMALAASNHALLVPIERNLVDETWVGRPARPAREIVEHPIQYAGVGITEKINTVRAECRARKAWGVVVSMLDDVCWTLNLRGGDIDFNPVFWAYLVVPVDSRPTLFVNLTQLPQATYEYLQKSEILIEPYEDVVQYLEGVGKGFAAEDRMIVPSRTNLALSQAVGLDKLDVCRGPIGDLKAVKNPTEIEGFRQCHIRDGVALTRYFAWLEAQLHAGARITESEGSDKLESLRSELELFKGLSFTTISSTGANASVIHYQPHPTDSAVIDRNEIYLCDSGAQFLDGTTDTTRTWHFGTPKPDEVRAATRVLQGHIAIDELVFPSTTTGYILDAFARRALWQDGLDYRHGTGHGVGSFLNVHEGPHGIGTRVTYNDVKLKAGFTVSNEPGYYADGAFGIRIENVVVVTPVQTRNNFGGVGWLGFERFTMVPISTKLADASLMTPSEIKWLNDYNLEVRTKLHALVAATGDTLALEWLERETKPLV